MKQRFGFIVLVALIAVLFSLPPSIYGEDTVVGKKMAQLSISLGLDLKGGTELDYKIDLSGAEAQNQDDDISNDVDINRLAESVRDALEERVNPSGLGEVSVKRSEVDLEKHVLIQLPPGANVLEAKANAEKDNTLEFFEETPEREAETRLAIASLNQTATAENWDIRVEELTVSPKVSHFVVSDQFKDSISDPSVADRLFAAEPGTVLEAVIETMSEPVFEFVDGAITQTEKSKPVIGSILVTEKGIKDRNVTTPPTTQARHILLGYEGALQAPEGVVYKTKEEAKAKADALLAQLKAEGTENFGDLAKEFSTEGLAATSGGDLGTVTPQTQFVQPFKDAIFGTPGLLENQEGYQAGFNKVGLIPELVETPFGFHIIELTTFVEETSTVETQETVTYEMIAWDRAQLVWSETGLGGKQLQNAMQGYDEIGRPVVNILFDSEGAEIFAALTKRLASKQCPNPYAQFTGEAAGMVPCRLGIKVGGRFESTPQVSEPLYGNSSSITGSTTFEEARELADTLNLGAIEAPVKLVGDITIKAELGQEQLEKSLKAGAMGLLLTMLFMIFLYRWAGVVASIALLIYVGLYIVILKIWGPFTGSPIVVSLSGVAGIALSIGLAVDANILIFERLKEELHEHNRNIHQAVDLGFERAWSAIKDSNFTTLLTCVILFTVGSSVVKGFAITLIVGTLLSLFTAITISRTLLRLGLMNSLLHKHSMYGRKPKRFRK